MTGGHQILKTAGATKHADRMAKVPLWALDDKEVQRIVLAAFPNLRTDSTQAERAGRWVRITHLYYRVGWTSLRIADEMEEAPRKIQSTIQKIVNVANGKTARGTIRGGTKPRGRPKKIRGVL